MHLLISITLLAKVCAEPIPSAKANTEGLGRQHWIHITKPDLALLPAQGCPSFPGMGGMGTGREVAGSYLGITVPWS